MSRSPREVAEQVRRMVAGEGVEFADLFAEDGVLTYPFGLPGQPAELHGREAIRGYFRDLSRGRDLLVMEGVEARGPRDRRPRGRGHRDHPPRLVEGGRGALPAYRPRRDPGARRRDRPL